MKRLIAALTPLLVLTALAPYASGRPATCTHSPTQQRLEIDGITTASGYAGDDFSISVWVYLPATLGSSHAYIMSESVAHDDLSAQRFAIRCTGTTVIGEYWEDTDASGTPDALRVTAPVSISTASWHLVTLVREGVNLSLWLDDPEWDGSSQVTTADATINTVSAANSVGSTVNCLNLFRGPSGINTGGGQGGLGPVTLIRFPGSLAYAAGWQGALTANDRVMLWNNGIPSSRATYRNRSVTLAYFYPLNSHWPDYYGGTALGKAGDTNNADPVFTQTRSVTGWETADAFSLSASFLDDCDSAVAFWTFQSTYNDGSSAFVDRINGVTLVHDDENANNGAGTNIDRVGDGVFGEYALDVGSTGASGIAGDAVGLWVPPDDEKIEIVRSPGRRGVTVAAWVKPKHTQSVSNIQMGLIAGIWDEQLGDDGQRKYALFKDLRDLASGESHPRGLTVNGHVSSDGGATPGEDFNYDVSYTGESYTPGYWQYMAMTWNPETGEVTSYLNGVAHPSPRNPYAPGYNTLHDSTGAFRVGGVGISDGGGVFGNYANSYIAGIAVFDEYMNAAQIAAIGQGQNPDNFRTISGSTMRNRSRP